MITECCIPRQDQNRYIDYEINENNISINEKFSGLKYHYQYKKGFNLNWKEILTGKKRLEEQFNNSNKDFHKNILNLFQILIENHHLDISFEPINNSKLYILMKISISRGDKTQRRTILKGSTDWSCL